MEENRKSTLIPGEEQRNRALFVLLILLLLLIFMDSQARRHYNSLGREVALPASRAEEVSEEVSLERRAEETAQIGGNSIEGVIEQSEMREQLAQEALQEGEAMVAPILESKSEAGEAGEEQLGPIRAKADTILGKAEELAAEIGSAVKAQIEKEVRNSRKKLPQKELNRLLTQPVEGTLGNHSPYPADSIAYSLDHYWLYYFYFRDSKSQLVKVARPNKGARLRLTTVVKRLQKGPLPHERNLLNNFDSRIAIHSIYIDGNQVVVDLNENIGRLGRHVIRDRLDQLVYTLTQFPHLQEVTILINGKRDPLLGKAAYQLPAHLYRSGRSVADYH